MSDTKLKWTYENAAWHAESSVTKWTYRISANNRDGMFCTKFGINGTLAEAKDRCQLDEDGRIASRKPKTAGESAAEKYVQACALGVGIFRPDNKSVFYGLPRSENDDPDGHNLRDYIAAIVDAERAAEREEILKTIDAMANESKPVPYNYALGELARAIRERKA